MYLILDPGSSNWQHKTGSVKFLQFSEAEEDWVEKGELVAKPRQVCRDEDRFCYEQGFSKRSPLVVRTKNAEHLFVINPSELDRKNDAVERMDVTKAQD